MSASQSNKRYITKHHIKSTTVYNYPTRPNLPVSYTPSECLVESAERLDLVPAAAVKQSTLTGVAIVVLFLHFNLRHESEHL